MKERDRHTPNETQMYTDRERDAEKGAERYTATDTEKDTEIQRDAERNHITNTSSNNHPPTHPWYNGCESPACSFPLHQQRPTLTGSGNGALSRNN